MTHQFFYFYSNLSLITLFNASDQPYGSPSHAELLSVPLTGPNGTESDGDVSYVHQADKELNAAQEREREGDYSAAVQRYRMAVDIFMKGVQGMTNGCL